MDGARGVRRAGRGRLLDHEHDEFDPADALAAATEPVVAVRIVRRALGPWRNAISIRRAAVVIRRATVFIG